MAEATAEPVRRCSRCRTWQPLSEFYTAFEHRQSVKRRRRWVMCCRSCNREKMMARLNRQRDIINSVKVERGCADCGLRSDIPEVYDFDHLPGFEKVADIARMRIGNVPDLLAEIAKCEVVCANCHRIRTAQRRAERGCPSRKWDLRIAAPVPLEDPQLALFDIA